MCSSDLLHQDIHSWQRASVFPVTSALGSPPRRRRYCLWNCTRDTGTARTSHTVPCFRTAYRPRMSAASPRSIPPSGSAASNPRSPACAASPSSTHSRSHPGRPSDCKRETGRRLFSGRPVHVSRLSASQSGFPGPPIRPRRERCDRSRFWADVPKQPVKGLLFFSRTHRGVDCLYINFK